MRVSFPALVAEVSDKMMSFPTLLLWNAALIVAAWWLVRRSRWLALVPLCVAAIFALATLDELRDPHVGPAVIHELGYAYVALIFFPSVVVLALLIRGGRAHGAHQNA